MASRRGNSSNGRPVALAEALALPVHPAATLLPMLPTAELEQLAADIAAQGLQHPLVLLDGQLLDGRNRLAACERAGVTPRVVVLEACPSPAAYVLSANLHRRHLDESQRALVGARAKPLFEAEAKARMTAGKAVPPSANLREGAQGKAAEQAASLVNVSPRSVESASRVLRDGAPELVEAVERGDVSVSAAAEVARLPQDEQREVLAEGRAKDVAKKKRAKKASTKDESAAPAEKAAAPEPPDACPKCQGKRFRYAPEPRWDGETDHRWVCQGCGSVARPAAPPAPAPAAFEPAPAAPPPGPAPRDAECVELIATINRSLVRMSARQLRRALEWVTTIERKGDR